MYYTDKKLHDILTSLLPTLKWLKCAGTVDVDRVPVEHSCALKQLDNLGLVYKRNSRTYGLQGQRLRRLIERIEACADHASCYLVTELLSDASPRQAFKPPEQAHNLTADASEFERRRPGHGQSNSQ